MSDMPNGNKPARRSPPPGILPPIAVDDSSEVIELWSGEAKLQSAKKTFEGAARVFAELLPRPAVRFSIETKDKSIFWDALKSMAGKESWLTSLYSINTGIPPHCQEIAAYGNANNLKDLLEVLADVRNALIHGTPKKVERLFKRQRGDDERTELWYQIGGILDQVLLAVIGYQGKVTRRDLDVQLKTSAIKQVPWAAATSDLPEATKDTPSSGTK